MSFFKTKIENESEEMTSLQVPRSKTKKKLGMTRPYNLGLKTVSFPHLNFQNKNLKMKVRKWHESSGSSLRDQKWIQWKRFITEHHLVFNVITGPEQKKRSQDQNLLLTYQNDDTPNSWFMEWLIPSEYWRCNMIPLNHLIKIR